MVCELRLDKTVKKKKEEEEDDQPDGYCNRPSKIFKGSELSQWQ